MNFNIAEKIFGNSIKNMCVIIDPIFSARHISYRSCPINKIGAIFTYKKQGFIKNIVIYFIYNP